jgi:hypothetical protein
MFRTPGTALFRDVTRIQAACADWVVFAQRLEVSQGWSMAEIYRWKAGNKPSSLFPVKFTRACQPRRDPLRIVGFPTMITINLGTALLCQLRYIKVRSTSIS